MIPRADILEPNVRRSRCRADVSHTRYGAAKPSQIIALSPPEAISSTIAATVPPVAVTVRAYGVVGQATNGSGINASPRSESKG